MIATLPNGLKADIGDDYHSFHQIHEIFYVNSYHSLSIKSGDFVLDCGAHIGLFTLKVARQCSHVFSVEPASSNFALLQKNIRLNNLEKKVTPIKKAIAARSGNSVTLYLGRSGATNTINPESSLDSNVETVECISVDDLSKEYSLRFDVIKINVEGAELEVLKGSLETLRYSREVIMEYHSEKLLEECRMFFASYGFNCVVAKRRRFTSKSWLLGARVLNSWLACHGRRPNFMTVISRAGPDFKTAKSIYRAGILYAYKAPNQDVSLLEGK